MWSRSLLRPCIRPCTRPYLGSKVRLPRSFASSLQNFEQSLPRECAQADLIGVSRRPTNTDGWPNDPESGGHEASADHTPHEQTAAVTRLKGGAHADEIHDHEQLHWSINPHVAQGHDCGFSVGPGSVGGSTWFSFSDSAKAKVDLVDPRLFASIPKAGGPQAFGRSQRTALLRMLDKACQESSHRGLVCLTEALNACVAVLAHGMRVTVKGQPGTTLAGTTSNASIVAVIDAPQRSELKLTWTINDVQVPIEHESTAKTHPWQITLRFRDSSSRAAQSPGISYTTRDDLWYLNEVAVMVIGRVTNAMSFPKISSMLHTVAQSLLQVLQLRTSSLELYKVHVQDIRSKTQGFATRPGVDVNSATDLDQEVHEQDGEDTHQETVGEDTVVTIEGDNIQGQILDIRRGVEGLHAMIGPVRLQASRTRFGAESYSLKLTWPESSSVVEDRITKADILRDTESAIDHAQSAGLVSLQEVAEMLRSSLQDSPHVSFRLRYPRKPARKPGQIGVVGDLQEELHLSYTTLDPRTRAPGFDLLMPNLKIVTKRLQASANDKLDHLRIQIIMHISPLEMTADGDRPEQQWDQLSRAIHNLLTSVADRSDSSSLEELANECAVALIVAPEVSRGRFVCTRVTARVRQLQSAGGSVGTARQTVASIGRIERPVIALGSNVGNRVHNIEAACAAIDADPDMAVCATSALYETRPMYVEDQGTFVNGVCKIETPLSPTQLLDRLQGIENNLGRVKIIDKGPRNIDLDIATHGTMVIKTERLTVPHQLMLEREFVLRPFCDIHHGYKHPLTRTKMAEHLKQLATEELSMFPLTPLAPGREALRSLDPLRRTHVMSILNVTPDSFSDGGDNQPTHMDALRSTVASHIAAGATVIDIGGQSSRPNAPDVTAEEEIARILPAIEILRSMPEAKHITISIDTYRAAVAEAAINAGAHIINDISAGLLDPDMLPTVARLGCTYVMMHMRGTPATMQQPENTTYGYGLVHTVASELCQRLKAAEKAGIRRWRIILDPGVGFAKTVEQNAELLGRFEELRNHPKLKTYPWLVGSSRKGFIGKITGAEDPKDRVEGTAATVTAAVAGGAEIVRVHDVEKMVRVVKMADAMYRRLRSQPPAAEGPAKTEEEEQDGENELEEEEELGEPEEATNDEAKRS